MTERPELPEHDHLAGAVATYHPAELHGLLCGLLCVDPELNDERWLTVLDADAAEVRDPHILARLRRATAAQLGSDDFDFALLLPDDDMNLSVRAAALGFWCQGLLAGLGLGGLPETSALSADSREFLDDVSQIARVGLDGDCPDDEDEQAYTEIVEYLRVGLLLTAQELAEQNAARPASDRLH